jgi:hypothetical protein
MTSIRLPQVGDMILPGSSRLSIVPSSPKTKSYFQVDPSMHNALAMSGLSSNGIITALGGS